MVLGVVHPVFHDRQAALGDQRSHLHTVFQTVAHIKVLGDLGEALDELLVDVLLHVKARRRNADLARVAELVVADDVDGLVHVRVVEDDHGGMPAQLHRAADQVLGGQLLQMLADRDRARERQLLDAAVPQHVARYRVRHAEDHVQHTVWKARLLECAGHRDGGAGRFLGRLDDQRTARAQCRPDLADHVHTREVPRDKGRGWAHGLLERHLAGTRDARRNDPAIGAFALFAVPAQDVDTDIHLDLGLADGLAHLLGHVLRDAVDIGGHDIAGLVDDRLTLDRRHLAPHLEACRGSVQGLVDIGGRGMRAGTQNFLGRGVDDVLRRSVRAVPELAVDQ